MIYYVELCWAMTLSGTTWYCLERMNLLYQVSISMIKTFSNLLIVSFMHMWNALWEKLYWQWCPVSSSMYNIQCSESSIFICLIANSNHHTHIHRMFFIVRADRVDMSHVSAKYSISLYTNDPIHCTAASTSKCESLTWLCLHEWTVNWIVKYCICTDIHLYGHSDKCWLWANSLQKWIKNILS